MAEKKPKAGAEKQPLQGLGSQWWNWFSIHADAVAVIITVLLSVGAGVWYVAWYVSKYDSRLGNLESTLNGSGELVERVRNLESSVGDIKTTLGRLESTAKLIEDYVLPLVFKPRAEALLGTPDVGVFRVVNNDVIADPRGFILYKNPEVGEQLFFTFTPQGIKKDLHKGEIVDFLVARIQYELGENEKSLRTILDRSIQMVIPAEIGKPVNYCLRLGDEKSAFVTEFVCIELVLLGKIQPNDLVFASAVKPEVAS